MLTISSNVVTTKISERISTSILNEKKRFVIFENFEPNNHNGQVMKSQMLLRLFQLMNAMQYDLSFAKV